ncbi:MAG TPA: FUSC family protein [Solirubrobacteraceae bacterium]
MTEAATPRKRILAGITRFDRSEFQLVRGIRYAVGVGIPLFVGVATGYTIEGIAVAGGATLIGLTDSGAPYRQRVPTMLIAAAAAAVSTFVGEVTGSYDVVAVVLLALWSFGAGMFIALGLPAYFVALMGPLSMVLVASYPADAVHSLERAALVFVGGLIQIALVLVIWRIHAHRPERAAIARLYRAMAVWISDPRDADHRTPVLAGLDAARETLDLAGGNVAAPSPASEAFRTLLDEADRTYLDLVALRNARTELESRDTTVSAALAVGREAAAEALAAIADALDSGRWRGDTEALRSRLDDAVGALRDELARRRASGERQLADQLAGLLKRGASVRGELRAAVDLAVSWQGEGPPPGDPVRHRRSRPPELATRGARAILRANLTLRSSAFRHAIRLGATVAAGAAIYRALDLPHGYWVPLTVLFVLRPDFGSTFTRGLQRYIGTAAGVVLATVIAAAFHPGPYALAALSTVLAVGIFAFLLSNYGLFTVSVTAFIVFFVAFGGIPEYKVALQRLLATVIGATLTLGFYALWPTWERSTLPDTLAELTDADRGYLNALLTCWLDPATQDRDAIRAARGLARLARTNAEAAVQRALDEPSGNRTMLGTTQATSLLASLRRMVDGALALEAYLDDARAPAPREAGLLAGQLDAALVELADATRRHRPPGPLPPLRETQQELSARVGATAPLAEETDRIVNSVVIAADVLARSAPSASPGSRGTSRTSTGARPAARARSTP